MPWVEFATKVPELEIWLYENCRGHWRRLCENSHWGSRTTNSKQTGRQIRDYRYLQWARNMTGKPAHLAFLLHTKTIISNSLRSYILNWKMYPPTPKKLRAYRTEFESMLTMRGRYDMQPYPKPSKTSKSFIWFSDDNDAIMAKLRFY